MQRAYNVKKGLYATVCKNKVVRSVEEETQGETTNSDEAFWNMLMRTQHKHGNYSLTSSAHLTTNICLLFVTDTAHNTWD